MKEKEKQVLRLLMTERDLEILMLMQDGVTQKAIAPLFNISASRVFQIACKTRRKILRLEDGYYDDELMHQLRNKFVLSARISGQTLKEVGDKLGLTQERIRQIEFKAKRVKKIDPNSIESLPVRIQGIFNWMEIKNKDDALSAIKSGKLNATCGKGMPSIPNYGVKSHKVILDWLGL